MTTEAVEEVESAGDAGPVRLREQYRRQRAGDVVTAIFEGAECVERREVEEAVSKLEAQGDLSDVQRDAVEEMADAIVDRLLAPPARSILRADSWDTIRTAHRLFDPQFETSDGKVHAGSSDRPEVNDDD